jgi:diguanylate cyclase (GGDEF)-like protein/PAS domain S-box-containing protein
MALKSLVQATPGADGGPTRILEGILEKSASGGGLRLDGEDGWRALVEALPQAVFRKDCDGRFLFVNAALCRALGCPAEEILGKTDLDLLPQPLAERIRQDDGAALERGERSMTEYDWPGRPARLLKMLRVPLRAPDGKVIGLQGVGWEGTRDGAAVEEELFLFETMIDRIPDSIYFKDLESRFTRANQYTAERFGLRSPEELIGKTDFDLFTDEHASQAYRDELEIIRTGKPVVNVEEKETLPDGRVRWVSTTKMPVSDTQGRIIGTFGISRDITERKLAEERLAYQAFYDPLTGLPNRALFLDRLEHLFRRTARRRQADCLFAIVFLDLDRFKGVNDSLGHQAGDTLLVQLARRLETCLRPSDTLARLGGDEFCILLEDIRTEADATRIADRIHHELLQPFVVHAAEFFFTASVGIALSSSGYERPEDMLRDADTAMHRAKSNGRSRHEIFDSDMHARAVTLLRLETDLRRALERNECRVYYQPIVDLDERRLAGFEALLRWAHPQRGMVMPDVFVPIAEETGLIGPLGMWVLREACRQMREWQCRFPAHAALRIAVNMSTRQLAQPDLVAQVESALGASGLAPSSLAIELTESALMHNVTAGAQVIRKLHDMKVGINIDDFGTGYSSLSYLQTFPVDTLKIDRSFVRQMSAAPGESTIVRAIVALAQSLGMSVTAEGVETREQIELLRAMGCRRAQGFYFARPQPAAEIERLLQDGLPEF